MKCSHFILMDGDSSTREQKYYVFMANPKHTIHVGIAVAGVLVGAVLSVFTGDPAVALMFSGGAMSSIGYWLGASAQRRHG